MSFTEGILQGILQGLAEFLPISSSGHLSVFQHFFGIQNQAVAVFMHLGTLFSVFFFFHKQIWGLICELFLAISDIFTGKFSFKNAVPRRKMLFMLVLSCLPLLIVFPLRDWIGALSEDGDIFLEGIGFLFSGFLILISAKFAFPEGKGKTALTHTPVDALLIGAAQAVATLPGVSRSGSTISSSLILGLERSYAFEYSFVLGIPAVLAATASEVWDVSKNGLSSVFSGSAELWACVAGVVIAAVVGFAAIKLVGKLVRSNKFKYFGYYCLAAGVFTVIAAMVEKAS